MRENRTMTADVAIVVVDMPDGKVDNVIHLTHGWVEIVEVVEHGTTTRLVHLHGQMTGGEREDVGNWLVAKPKANRKTKGVAR